MADRPTGTVTFLFTDIEGSTRLWAADHFAMSASLACHDAIVRSAIEDAGGYVFSTSGDAFAAAFARASDAVTAAGHAQAELDDASWPGPALRVRMGLHLGEAEERGGNYFGPAVNLAARVSACGHGGQVLMTEAVRSIAAVAATDLGHHRLRDVGEAVHLFQLGDQVFPPLRVVDPPASNLPVRPTPLLGRDADLHRVRRLLETSRLVTITAAGGLGKTRLAIAVGEAELPIRPAGVWFVDLTAVVNEGDVPAAVAKALGLTLRQGDLVDQLVGFLADKPALVILDNCEHVIDVCAEFAHRFLTVGGRSVVLATSREALDVDGEHVVVLGPLTSEGAEAPAVRLFADRAAEVAPSFTLDDSNLGSVMALCRHLDGMPLAIELAAARTTVMTPKELFDGLHDRFGLLSGGRSRRRQRTLEATLHWSYDLLTAEERRVFRALGVFVDGFDLDAAAAVADVPREAAVKAVEGLVAKSLVVRADRVDRARFDLLETVKVYAEDRLAEAGESDAARDRHLSHFLSRSTVHGRTGYSEMRLGIALVPDRSNLTAAFQWAATTACWGQAAELIMGSYATYLFDGASLEARGMAHRALTACAVTEPELVEYLRLGIAHILVWLNEWSMIEEVVTPLLDSEQSWLRGFAHGVFALLSGLSDGSSVDEHLQQADAELADAGASPDLNVELTRGLVSWCRARITAGQGDIQVGLRDTEAFIACMAANDYYTTAAHRALKLACSLHILVGDLAIAQERIGSLASVIEGSTLNVEDVSALAHLAAGELHEATSLIRKHSARALTGRMTGEACDSALLLTALAHSEAIYDIARDLLLHMGLGLEPATVVYSNHLAAELGIADQHRVHQRGALAFGPDSPEGPSGHSIAMAAVRREFSRRGWT